MAKNIKQLLKKRIEQNELLMIHKKANIPVRKGIYGGMAEREEMGDNSTIPSKGRKGGKTIPNDKQRNTVGSSGNEMGHTRREETGRVKGGMVDKRINEMVGDGLAPERHYQNSTIAPKLKRTKRPIWDLKGNRLVNPEDDPKYQS